jgi:sugar phosphate permease
MQFIARLAQGRVHYAWIVAFVTFLVLLTAAATRATPGVLIVPLQKEFGWSTATISAAVSLNLVLFGLMGPFSAAVVDRLGARRTMLIAVALVATGVLLTTFMTKPWQLILLWGGVVGGGAGFTALALGATVVNRWFTTRRGVAIGLLTASSATGQLLFLPFLAKIVTDHGWRMATVVVACVGILALPLIALFMRDQPSDLGLNRYGEPGVAEPQRRSSVNPAWAAIAALGEGMRSRDFWLLFGTFFICGLSTNGLIGTHLIPACFDHGIPEVKAASLLAVMGVFDLVGTLGSGWLSDRWSNRALLFWYYGLRGLSLLFLPFSFDLSFYGLSLFAVFYGLDWVATVPPTVRLAADCFGREKSGLMFGWIFCGHQLGAAAAAYGAGLIRTDFGDYLSAFMIAGAFCLLASLLVLGIGRGRRRVASAPAPAPA